MISYITLIPQLLIGSNKSGGKSGSVPIARGEGGAAARLIRKVNWEASEQYVQIIIKRDAEHRFYNK